jgi:MFS transporter, DHA1 family, multidrug resistance protein
MDSSSGSPNSGPHCPHGSIGSVTTQTDAVSTRHLYILSAAVLVAMTGMGIVWPLIPLYAHDLGATGLQLGLIISSFPLARTLFNPPMGRLSDLTGRRRILCVGLLLYALLSVLYILASRVETLFAVRFLHGFASVLVVPVAMAMVGDIAPRNRQGLYMGTLNMAVMLGLGLGPMLGGGIRELFGMDAAFYSMGGLTLLTLLGVRAFVPDDRSLAPGERRRPPVSMLAIARHPVLLGLFLLRLVSAAGHGCVFAFLPLLGLQIHLSSAQVGLVLGANVLITAFLQRSFGAMADRGNPVHQIVFGALLSGAAILAMPVAEGFWGVLALNLLMGLGGGISMPAGLAMCVRVGQPMGMGSVIGFLEMGYGLGMIASPVFSGLIMDLLGLPVIFVIGGGIILLGTLGMFRYLNRSQREPV